MQIVIDIPEEIYNHTQEYEVGGFNQENDTKLFIAIKNGTPLPKGHGRLIDADALPISHGVFVPRVPNRVILGTPMDAVFADEIKDAPTIIEADKESE